jgi:NADH-quinone oxidoreductase subunit F
VDSARVASRLPGVEEVTILYRRTLPEMPAFEEETESCLEENVDIQFLTAPKKILVKDGKITGVECMKMELGDIDESGRRRPVPIEGSEVTIEVDTLIVAISERPDTSFLKGEDGFEFTPWGTVVVDPENYTTSMEGVFAGGDVVTGPSVAIEAMGAGKVVAELIDKYLQGRPVERDYKVTRPSLYVEPVELTEEEVAEAMRPEMECRKVDERICSFDEVDLGLPEAEAVKEARRCLRCDLETEEGKKQFES